MNALTLLTRDHASIQKLFERYEALGPKGEARRKQEIAREVIHELSIHAAIEEQLFYPAVKARDGRLAALINQSLEEHKVAKWELAALEVMVPEDARFDAKFAVLVENVRLHLGEEEGTLFPAMRRVFSERELESLGEALAVAQRVVPTHPHPRMPDEPPGNTVVGPVLGVLDRGRDLLAAALERSLTWLTDLGRRLGTQSAQLVQGGRERATDLGDEAQRWTMEAPARVLKVSNDALEVTRQRTRRATQRAQRATAQAVEAVADSVADASARSQRKAAQAIDTSAEQVRSQSRAVQRSTAVRRLRNANARNVRGSLSLRADSASAKTVRGKKATRRGASKKRS